MLLLVGVIDDAYEISASIRLGLHLLAATLMVFWGGNTLSSFGDLLFFGPIALGYFAVPVTLFAVASAINAINMSDGVDGLSGGLVLIALVFMTILAYDAGLTHAFMLLGVLICSLIGFLILNFRFPWRSHAHIFMGDAGSTVLGFILAWMLIYLAQHQACSPAAILWLIALPLMDTASVIALRKLEGRSLFSPGRDHLHHKLLDAGLGVRKTVLVMHAIALCFGLFGLIGQYAHLPDGIMFISFIALLSAYIGMMHRFSKKEVILTGQLQAADPS